jgi:glutamine synthetase
MFDSHGHLVAKRYHVANLRKSMTEGVRLVAAILAGSPSGEELVVTSPLADPNEQFRDGVLRMDPESCRNFPLDADGRGLLLIGEFVDQTRAYCSRALLGDELARLRQAGYEAVGALELESVALSETAASLAEKSARALTFRQGYRRPYQLVAEPADLAYLDELNAVCASMDVALDSQHPEFMHLLETSLRPEVGVRIADNAALYKNVAKLLARRHGFMMSFMARWHTDQQGCGAHFNVSLTDTADRRAVFYDPAAENGVSNELRWFVGGLHAYLPELFLLLAPNLNSYKRFVPGAFTPLNNSWGIDNKTVAHRVLVSTAESARVEMRLAGADVSPHLGLLAVLLAGRTGLAERREPPPPVRGNGWALDNTPGPGFPASFTAAIETFETSALARDNLGTRFVAAFTEDRRWQLARFQRAVTDWELQMFADGG